MSRQKRASKTQYPVTWLVLGLVLLLLIAGLAAWRGGFLRKDPALESLRGQAERYTFESGAQQTYSGLDGGVAAASSTGLQILDGEGYTVLRSVVSVTTPALTASDKSAAVYDVGGTILRVGNLQGELTVLDTTDAILSANMNRAGWMAVVTEETGYKGRVTVYNAEMEPVYAWHSGSQYVLSARVSPDCRTMVALTLEESGSAVHIFSLSSETEYAAFSAENTLLFDCGFLSNDRLCAVYDGGLMFFNTAGTDAGGYSFGGAYLAGYSLEGDGFATVLLSQYLSGNAGTVVTVGYGGNVSGQLTPEDPPQGISVWGDRVLIRYAESVALYSQSLEEQTRLEESQGARDAVLAGKKRGYLLFSGYCEALEF